MTDDVVRWVLDAIVEEWPSEPFPHVDEWPYTEFPEDIVRYHGDESRVLEWDEHTRALDPKNQPIITASRGDLDDEPAGVEFSFELEQTVSVRFEATTAAIGGTLESAAEANRLGKGIKEALKRQRGDPSFSPGGVYYHTLTFDDDESLSSDNRDYYRLNLLVRLDGAEIRND